MQILFNLGSKHLSCRISNKRQILWSLLECFCPPHVCILMALGSHRAVCKEIAKMSRSYNHKKAYIKSTGQGQGRQGGGRTNDCQMGTDLIYWCMAHLCRFYAAAKAFCDNFFPQSERRMPLRSGLPDGGGFVK